jgi:hypothetical protein
MSQTAERHTRNFLTQKRQPASSVHANLSLITLITYLTRTFSNCSLFIANSSLTRQTGAFSNHRHFTINYSLGSRDARKDDPPPPPIDHSTLSYYTTKTYSRNSYKFPFKTSTDYPLPDSVISRNGDRIPRNKTHLSAFLHINFRKKRGCFYALGEYLCRC